MLHLFRQRGFNVVVDVNSGGVHVVDDLTYAMLPMLTPPLSEVCPSDVSDKLAEKYNKSDILSAYDEIYSLYVEGSIFSSDEIEKYAKFSVPSPIKAMCLHIAHDCNLRCSYCFASTGDFGGARTIMPFETGKRAFDFLIEQSKGRENLEVDFFGGEPLLNFEVVKQLVEYGRELEKKHGKHFSFTITTNGLLLDDNKIDFINKEMSNVVLSIDGRKSVNDKVRSRINGSGCYDAIMPKFKRLVNKRGDGEYYARGTFTKYNLDFSEDVFHLLLEGFDQVSVEPVVSPPDMPYALTNGDIPAICNEYERLTDRIIALKKDGGFINFFHFMLDLDDGPCAIKRLRGCGCGNEYVAVTPDGDLFPCHQFVGIDKFKMGNLYDGSFNTEMKAEFAGAHIYSKEKCRDCWAKFYCSGGCNANNYLYGGNILTPLDLTCELEKKRLECAILLKIVEKENEINAL